MGYAFGAGGAVSELLLAALAGVTGPAPSLPLDPATAAGDVCEIGPAQTVAALIPAIPSAILAPSSPVPSTAGAAGGFVDLSPGASIRDGAVRRAADGLFYVNAEVNGVPVRFLIDTGASIVVLTPLDAARIGVMPSADAFRHEAETAGGRTAMARVTLARLAAGTTERQDIDAAVGSAGLGVSLLGQSWLSKLQSITIAGDEMVMR